MNFEKLASNFCDWLIDMEYAYPEDKELDYSDMVEDFQNAYKVAPRLVNLLRDISDR